VVQPYLAPVRIRKLLLHLADEFAAEADMKGLSLRVRAPDVWIESDGLLLERILRNLLSNAMCHTTRGGILISARPCQGQLRLQIWDTGSGIPLEHQSRIFEEFYQADTQNAQTRHGLGLGLAIVRRLARLLDHPLQLHSNFGQGTVFSLDVPLAAKGAAQAGEPLEPCNGRLAGRVLVVDHDPDILGALGNLLRQWGLEVRLIQNLHQHANEPDPAPDIALVDYQLLNGESGLMVAEEMHRRWGRRIPVILITGHTRTETIQLLRETGYPTLYKPVHAEQLRALLSRLLQDLPAPPNCG
jgi:CheY-like chemotaxis protein